MDSGLRHYAGRMVVVAGIVDNLIDMWEDTVFAAYNDVAVPIHLEEQRYFEIGNAEMVEAQQAAGEIDDASCCLGQEVVARDRPDD